MTLSRWLALGSVVVAVVSMKKRDRMIIAAVSCLLLTSSIAAEAASIQIFGTGVDSSGTKLAPGSTDPHFSVDGGNPTFVVTPSAFYAVSATSAWIWINAGGTDANSTHTFQTTFDLTGLDYATAVVNGAWGADNYGRILLNGNETGFSLPGPAPDLNNFGMLHSFSITSGFVAGINTLAFVVVNVGDPAALRVDQPSAAADPAVVPLPGAAPFFATALGAVGLLCSRRKPKRQPPASRLCHGSRIRAIL